MWMTVGERRFAITLGDSDTARAFAAQLPLTLDMEELNGNEKHTRLPRPLPTKASRPGTIRNGAEAVTENNTNYEEVTPRIDKPLADPDRPSATATRPGAPATQPK